MPTTNMSESCVQLVQEEHGQTEEIRVEYSLYRIRIPYGEHYAVHIRTPEEMGMQILGTDFEYAQRLFEILVNEIVTPCTLCHILYDVQTAEAERNHEQNLCKI